MKSRPLRPLLVLATALAAQAQTPPLPMSTPAAAGFSAERLQRIDDFFAREIERNRVPGAVIAIARNGKRVYFKAHGWGNKDKGVRVGTDTIDHLGSMTKIMTAAGALSLTEQGRPPLRSKLADH